MKPPVTPCLVVFILVVFPFAYSSPPKPALNPERLELIEKALSWLNLRWEGKLLEPARNSELLNSIYNEYNLSLYFRTIVIAFQYGVLPKLTLQQGQPCDPAYTLRYKSEVNNSATWYKVKNFTLESYYDLRRPGSPTGPYCDSTKGLVCLPATKECDCPEGSRLQQIAPNSPQLRCLIDEDEVCPIPDLKALRDYTILKRKLPELIFNLEKPQNCKQGTTCAIKDSPFAKCLSTSKGPFQNNAPQAKYGEECVLDYVGEGDACDVKVSLGGFYKHSVCFNFMGYLQNKRSPTSQVHQRKGFCALDVAPYITPGITKLSSGEAAFNFEYPFVNGFVNPGTVKMSSSELLEYDRELCKITANYTADRASSWSGPGRITRIQRDVGKPCSVSDTEKMIEIWNFYAGLEEKDPPAGQDVVADIPMLKLKMGEYKSLLDNHVDYEPKICRIFWEKGVEETPPLTCVSTGAGPDSKGNDGTCQVSNNRDTYALTLNMYNFRWDDYKSKNQIRNPDYYYDKAILKDNPELRCSQSQNQRLSRSLNSRKVHFQDKDPHVHGVVLEDASCSEGFGCVMDFSESHGIYKSPKDKIDCSFVDGYQPLYNCLDVVSNYINIERNSCEEELLNKRVMDATQTAPRLAMGATCSYQLIKDIEDFFGSFKWYSNRYRIIFGLETIGLCDRTKLLECSQGNICVCRRYSAPRTTADEKSNSDYCYNIGGPCKHTVSSEYDLDDDEEYEGFNYFVPLTEAQKAEMDSHYGTSSIIQDTCENGNVCKFIDACTSQCIDANSGSTGVDVDVIGGCAPITTTTTTTTTENSNPEPSRRPLKPPTPFNAAELSSKKQTHLGKFLTMIIILNSFTPVV